MDDSIFFLPEIVIVASIIGIPALYILTENNKSYSICSNISLGFAFMFLVLSWYYTYFLSLDKSSLV